MNEAAAQPNLLHRTAAGWRPVPAWTQFFRSVGRQAVHGDHKDSTIAILVPTRAYVAAFIALGAVEADLELPAEGLEHLEHLSEDDRLSIGIAGQMVRARFSRYATENGRYGMWVFAGGVHSFYPRTEWHRISWGDFGGDWVTATHQQRDRDLHWDEDFVKAALGIDDLRSLLVGNKLVAATVGTKVELSRELEGEEFAVRLQSGDMAFGHLEDAVRTRSFATHVEADSFRTEVVSHRHPHIESWIPQMRPAVLICDSPEAFIKHRSASPGSCVVAVLDLTDSATGQAISQFERDYAVRPETERPWPFDSEPPPGVIVSVLDGHR